MTKQEKDIRRRIVATAVDLIEQTGISRLTVRAIARKAHVNVAAISYYFGSKEKLLDAVLVFTLDNAFTDPLAELRSRSFTPAGALRSVLADWLQGVVNFPGITRVHVLGQHLTKRQHARSVERFHGFLRALAEHLQGLQPARDPEDIRLWIAQKVSAVLLPSMLPELFRGFLTTDLRTSGGREVYLDHLLDSRRQRPS